MGEPLLATIRTIIVLAHGRDLLLLLESCLGSMVLFVCGNFLPRCCVFTRDVEVNSDTVYDWHTYLSSLPILAVVYRFFYLPTANLPIYHNLPISTDFFVDLPNFNFFYRYLHVLMVKSASPYNKYYL